MVEAVDEVDRVETREDSVAPRCTSRLLLLAAVDSVYRAPPREFACNLHLQLSLSFLSVPSHPLFATLSWSLGCAAHGWY